MHDAPLDLDFDVGFNSLMQCDTDMSIGWQGLRVIDNWNTDPTSMWVISDYRN